jgi:hypothetical protein
MMGWITEIVARIMASRQIAPTIAPVLPALIVNESGWLEGEGVEIIRAHSSWHYPRLSTPTGDPMAIVCHSSQTAIGTARSMANRRTGARTATDRAASWHISIEPTRIVQMVSCEAGAWHAIGSIKGAGAANRVSVGIELVGYEAGPWSAETVDQACRVWRALVQSYGIPRERAMVAHAVIDPKRRKDPGKPWMTQHAARVLDYAYA